MAESKESGGTVDTKCPNKNIHEPHVDISTVELDCDGRMPCGAWAHPKHTYTGTLELRCKGIAFLTINSGERSPFGEIL